MDIVESAKAYEEKLQAMKVVIRGTKEESALIRWVKKAESGDCARPVLNAMLLENDQIVACDGFRIHAAKAPGTRPQRCLSFGVLAAAWTKSH